MSDTYNIAYTEILEIIKYLPKEEYEKIPKEKIEFYKQNKDANYKFVFDVSKSLKEQNVSIKTNAIIVSLFREYFATNEQKKKLKIILQQNEKKIQEELREKYNPDDLFKNRKESKTEEYVEENNEQVALSDYKNMKWYKKIVYKITNCFKAIIKKDEV